MTRTLRLRFALCAGALLAGLAAAPTAGAAQLDTSLSVASTSQRACTAGLAEGAGVVRRTVTATASGLVSARLTGSGQGDWDLAVFGASNRLAAGSASFGLSELAQGIAAKGEQLTVQACRRSGPARSVRLTVDFLPIETSQNPEPIQLVRVKLPTEASREALDASGVDQTEHARAGIQDVLLHDSADAAKLRRAGLAFDVIVPDVVKADRQARTAAKPGDGTAVPSGRTDYRRLAQYGEDMKKLVAENPTLVKPITLPNRTLEGRAVEGIEITRDVNAEDGKPVFFQMGVHHAREWPSGEHAIEWAFELVNGIRAKNERVTKLLDRARVIVVPIINPDGFNLSREAAVDVPVGPIGILAEQVAGTGFAYKRRNCRIQDFAAPGAGECGAKANRTKGVDPNRNYGGFWGGPGASSAVTNDTYRGPAPFSEPETQNVRALVSSRQVTTLITNHTYSDLVLRPPGLIAQGDPPDEPVYKALGDAMAKENGYSSEKSWELYDTTGTTEDWSYYATGGLGFTFEIGKAADGPTGLETLVGAGFHPPYPVGVTNEWYGKYPTGGGNREAYFKALESTADPKMHSVIGGQAPAGAQIRLTKSFDTQTSQVLQPSGPPKPPILFRDNLDTTLSVPASGRFEYHANPSTRPITVKGEPGRAAQGPPTADRSLTSSGKTVSFPAQDPNLATPGSYDDFPFQITAGQDNEKISAVIQWADSKNDWDLYLYRENGTVDTELARSAQGDTTSEQLTATAEGGKPFPAGSYYVRVIDFDTTDKKYTGSVNFKGPDAFKAPAPRSESWTLSCQLGGATVAQRQVLVDRGERVDVGDACTRAGQSSANSGVILAGSVQRAGGDRTRYAIELDRRRLARAVRLGIRARARCSAKCNVAVALTVDRRTAKRLKLKSRTVATGAVTKSFSGRRTFKVRFTKLAKRRLARVKRVRFSVAGTVRDAANNRGVVRRGMTLR